MCMSSRVRSVLPLLLPARIVVTAFLLVISRVLLVGSPTDGAATEVIRCPVTRSTSASGAAKPNLNAHEQLPCQTTRRAPSSSHRYCHAHHQYYITKLSYLAPPSTLIAALHVCSCPSLFVPPSPPSGLWATKAALAPTPPTSGSSSSPIAEPTEHSVSKHEVASEPASWTDLKRWIPSREQVRRSAQVSSTSPVPPLYFAAGLLLLLVLLAQIFGSSDIGSPAPLPPKPTGYRLSPFGDSVYKQEAYYEQLEPCTQCKRKNIFSAELPVSAPLTNMALEEEAKRVAAQFEYSAEDVNKGVKEFIREMDEGLAKQGTMLSQIPTYVTSVPNGTEKGVYLAVDLGGTNFRVCSITLHGNQSFSLQQSKVAVPRALMEAKTAHELFSFLAQQIETFLKAHHADHFEKHRDNPIEKEFFDLGFTFSFPVNQIGINKGKLMRWTKGYDIHEAIGKDVCELLQVEIDALKLPVRVAALVNDTVGTLMARSYTSPGKTKTLIGAIFGTGTNGAYVEKLEKVKKMKLIEAEAGGKGDYDSTTGLMIINTEWGSFDNALGVLPDTEYDKDLDKESVNPGIQMFEKRVSGMFLGEILRRALLALYNHPNEKVALFKDTSSLDNDITSTTTVADDSALFKQWGIDTSFLSIVEEDSSDHLRITKQTLEKELGIAAASTEDCVAVKMLVHAIGKRAARLSAVALAGVIISTDKLKEDETVDIGIDGSLAEYYPGFEDYIREAFREIEGIGEDEKRIRIGLAKDGSGLGAALIALVAHNSATAA